MFFGTNVGNFTHRQCTKWDACGITHLVGDTYKYITVLKTIGLTYIEYL